MASGMSEIFYIRIKPRELLVLSLGLASHMIRRHVDVVHCIKTDTVCANSGQTMTDADSDRSNLI